MYTPVLFTADVTSTLAEAAREMEKADVGSLAVLASDQLVGILTERDLVRALGREQHPDQASVGPYVSTDLETADVEEDSRRVARRMLDLGVRHLPVLKSGQLVGIVSMRDLMTVEVWR
jgi:CBS domain-containing protein